MAKSVHADVLDGSHDIVRNNCTRQVVCSAQPTTYIEANATYMLATVTMTSTDFTKANGDTSGRKCTVTAKSSIVISTSGTATHVALLDVTNSKLLRVTTCTSQALTANGSNTVSIPAWKFEIADPT